MSEVAAELATSGGIPLMLDIVEVFFLCLYIGLSVLRASDWTDPEIEIQ